MPKIKGVDTVAIQFRRGDKEDFIPENLMNGEPAFVNDNENSRLYIGTGNDAKAIELARQIDVQRATQSEAQAGIDSQKIMTPLRTKEHVDYRLSSQSQAQIGTDNSVLITPSSLKSVYNDRKRVYSVSSSSTSYTYLYVTDGYLNNTDGIEVVIQPSSNVTSSNYIYLSLNGTSHIIVKPTGATSDYVTTLNRYVPYRLKRMTIGTTTRWVAMDYPTERYSLLGQAHLALASDYTMPLTGEVALPLTKRVILDTDVFVQYSEGVRINSSLVGDLYLEHNLSFYFFTGTAEKLKDLTIKADSMTINRALSPLPRYTTFSTGTLTTSVDKGQIIRAYFDGISGDVVKAQDYSTYLQLKLFRKNY